MGIIQHEHSYIIPGYSNNNWVGEGCEEAKAVEDNPFPRATSPDARLINGIPVYQLATQPVGRRSAGFSTMWWCMQIATVAGAV